MPTAPAKHRHSKHSAKKHEPINKTWGNGRGGRAWRAKRQQVFERDGYLCQICKSKGKLSLVTLHGSRHGVCDHIVPLFQGGQDDESNLQTICQPCDKNKTQLESQQARMGSVNKV